MTVSSVYLRISGELGNLSVTNSKYQNFITAFDMGGMFMQIWQQNLPLRSTHTIFLFVLFLLGQIV